MGNTLNTVFFGLTQVQETSPVYSHIDFNGKFPVENNPELDFLQPIIDDMRQFLFILNPDGRDYMMQADLHKMTNEVLVIYYRTLIRMMSRGITRHEAREKAVKIAKAHRKVICKEFYDFYYL